MTDAQRLSLRPPVVEMEWYKGSTLPIVVVATDEDGVAINLTGATAKMQIKNAAGTVVLALQTGGTGIALTNPTQGELTISPEVVGTSTLPLDNILLYDLKVTLADTSVYPWFRGIITLIEKITS
jgi:hypothetical protein